MIPGFEIEFRRLCTARDFHVVGIVPARRHIVRRKVGHVEQQVIQCGAHVLELALARIECACQVGDLLLERFDVLAGGLGRADCLRTLVAPALQFLDPGLQLLSAGFQRRKLFHVEVVAAARQRDSDMFEILTQQLRIEHCVS